MEVNKAERRLSLGYKQLTEDPWIAFEEAYKVDTITPAKVSKFTEKGVVVELPLGCEGFVPTSQFPEGSLAKISQSSKEGEEIQLAEIEFDKENKRILLSKKRLLELEKQKEKEAEKAEIEPFLGEKKAEPTLGEIAEKDSPKEKSSGKQKRPKQEASSKKEDESDQETSPETPPAEGSAQEPSSQ